MIRPKMKKSLPNLVICIDSPVKKARLVVTGWEVLTRPQPQFLPYFSRIKTRVVPVFFRLPTIGETQLISLANIKSILRGPLFYLIRVR